MILPINCQVEYISGFLSKKESKELYDTLIDQYKIDKARLVVEAGGRMIKTDSFKILFLTEQLKRKGSHPEYIHGKTHVWSGPILSLKNKIEAYTNKVFEIAMCLYYPNGNYFAPYHSDQQTSGLNTILPSISLGEEREFRFKEYNSKDAFSLILENGSLLLMGKYCQERYEHSLLKNSQYSKGRINITFREASFM